MKIILSIFLFLFIWISLRQLCINLYGGPYFEWPDRFDPKSLKGFHLILNFNQFVWGYGRHDMDDFHSNAHHDVIMYNVFLGWIVLAYYQRKK
jgi:hypothetical protein